MFLDMLEEKVRGKGVRIVFTEGWDERIQQAARALKDHNICVPLLLGNIKTVKESAARHQVDLSDIQIIDPDTFEEKDKMVQRILALRRGKADAEQAEKMLESTSYFGTMLVDLGYADGLLGGATYSTADTVRPALQLIKTAPGSALVSSVFLLLKDETVYFMSDCAINLNPNADDLVEITLQTARTAKQFGMEPRVALLSYSTMGSASGECVAKMAEAAARLKRMPLDFAVDGEMQFDAAIDPEVAEAKAPDSNVAGHANTFIFPNLSSGNIGYKIASRLGGYKAVGPILQGLNKPLNDLSRGCCEDEVYKMAVITAAQAVNAV